MAVGAPAGQADAERSSPLLTLAWQPFVARRPRAPLAMSLEEVVTRPHAIVTRARVNELVDATLAAHGLRRRIGLVTDSDLLIPQLIQGTDLVGLTLAPDASDGRVRVVELPVRLATSTFHLWWSAVAETDPAHRWFIDRVAHIARSPATRPGRELRP